LHSSIVDRQDEPVRLSTRRYPPSASRSAFAGFRFRADAITVAMRWYLRYGRSYRDVKEPLAERGVEVHVAVYRWVQRFTSLLADAARFARHSPGDRWFVDETYVKVNGVWRTSTGPSTSAGRSSTCLSRSAGDADGARHFFHRALTTLKVTPTEVVTDAAPVYPRLLDELASAAWHHVERHANNRIEPDHSRLKHRLAPMRGLRADHTVQVIITGLAFIQNLGRGHYELATETTGSLRAAAAFAERARFVHRRLDRLQRSIDERATPSTRSGVRDETVGATLGAGNEN
jgi:transposase-like protein